MKTFQSTVNGKAIQWELSLTIALCRRVKECLGLNLLDPYSGASESGKGSTLAIVFSDLNQFVDLIWQICKSQADGLGVIEQQFIDALDSAAFPESRTALFDEWRDFLDRSGVPAAAEGIRRQLEINQATAERIATLPLEIFMREADSRIAEILEGLPTA